MLIANIYPIPNQHHYKDEKIVMLLAHLLDKYNPKYFNDKQFIILDNGIYENAQVSTDLQDLVNMADKCKIPVCELVIPDKFFDSKETVRLFEKNLDVIRKYSKKYQFMFVAHHEDFEDFKWIMNYIEQYKDDKTLNLSVGIPKRARFCREMDEAIEIYKKCSFPIHFLGLADTTPLKDLIKVEPYIRSCDTSQIVTMIKNTPKNVDILSYVRKPEDEPIDLLNDYINEERLNNLLETEYDQSVLANFLGIYD